ncbi:MAG: UvrB/UvrC motif-containing protein, partial [Acidobacteriota bacterium]
EAKNSIIVENLYPHLKITKEKFPRLLVTRKILSKKDDCFGAFLPETGVRIWLGLLNKIFRLRSCEIKIDGEFPQPCRMFYEKRCVAPCVAEICSREEYAEYVAALRLFLSGDEQKYTEFLENKIGELAENLEYEKAAKWRDVLVNSQKLFADKKMRLWLNDAVDSFEIEETGEYFIVYLVTTRGRKFLGGKEFVFPKQNLTAEIVLGEIIKQFYKFHAPKEIRLTRDFPARKSWQKFLSEKFARPAKILIVRDGLNITTKRKIKQTKFESEFEKIGEPKSTGEIKTELQKIFKLKKKPVKIEVFDVAHISGQDFVAASVVWKNGTIAPEDFRIYISDGQNELDTMANSVAERLANKPFPNLLLIDGGISQLRAVKTVLKNLKIKNVVLISAVKPPNKHSELSHFLTSDEQRIEFIAGNQTYETLRQLRDEAHNAANGAHRQQRDNKHLFEFEKIFRGFDDADRKKILRKSGSVNKLIETDAKVFVDLIGAEKAAKLQQNLNDISQNENALTIPYVPIRFDEIGGAAEDLIPILPR